MLSVESPRQNRWLVDSTADVRLCNGRSLMAGYREQLTRIGRSTSDRISPGRGNVRLRLRLEEDSKGLLLNLRNVYYPPSSICNLALDCSRTVGP